MTWFKKKPEPIMLTMADLLRAEEAERQGRKPKWKLRVQQRLRRCIQKIESWFS